jgi:putative hemolysin
VIALLAIAVALILGNALYVAAEFAVLAARVTQIQQHAVAGSAVAAGLVPVVSNTRRLDTYIAVCQIGITVTSLALGAFGQATFGIMLGDWLLSATTLEPVAARSLAAIIVLVVMTSAQVVFGELIPKTVALQYPVRVSLLTYVPMRWSHVAFAPFLGLLNGSGALVLRWLGVDTARGHRHVHAPEEIEMLVRESREGGHIEETQRVRLQRTLRLSRRSVRQIMVPRRRIAVVDRDAPKSVLLDAVINSPYTRLIVQRGNLNAVEGYLHTKDLARAVARDQSIESLPALVRPVVRIPSGYTVDQALGLLRTRRSRLALVVDPLGDVEGLISIEDVMRELVGGLSDEFKQDTGPLAPTALADGTWRMPGRLPLDELSEWALEVGVEPIWATPGASADPGSSAETLGGWLIEQIGLLPKPGQTIALGALQFAIERLDGVAIDQVVVTRHPDGGDSSDG